MAQKDNKTFTFYTDEVICETVESKGEKRFFVTGYISTKNRDLLNDIVSETALSDMLGQIQSKNIKLDVEHEAWTENNPSIIPIGKIVEAKRDEKGIFVKAEINRGHSRFTEVWDSIKNGFLDAFSIAYKAKDFTFRTIDGMKTRILNSIDLLNIALTGNPVNPECKMDAVFTKSLKNYEEEKKMADEPEKKDEPQAETPEAPKEEEKKEETPTEEEKKEDAPKEEEKKEEPSEVEQKALKEVASLKKKLDEQDAEIKSLKKKLEEPIIKAEIKSKDAVKIDLKATHTNPLDAI